VAQRSTAKVRMRWREGGRETGGGEQEDGVSRWGGFRSAYRNAWGGGGYGRAFLILLINCIYRTTGPTRRPRRRKRARRAVLCAQLIGYGVCNTPELWRDSAAASLCARERACAGAGVTESLHIHTYHPTNA